jgi:hypothetical protein
LVERTALTSEVFAFFAESFANFAVKAFDLRSHLKGQNPKPQSSQRIPPRTQRNLHDSAGGGSTETPSSKMIP